MQKGQRCVVRLICASFLIAGIGAAQTQIGGGVCSSLSLNGTYALSMTGRQATAAAALLNAFSASGSATFDGQNTVSLSLATSTLSTQGTPATWSGTYTIQANCVATATFRSGSSAVLTLGVYNQGKDFLITGSDATYVYTGSGDVAPTACPASALAGVYTITGTGYGLSKGAISGASNGSGLLQFDGQGHITGNITLVGGNAGPVTLTGSYTASTTTCQGSATLSDSKGNSYVLTWVAYNGNATATTDLYLVFTQSSTLLITGSAHAAFGQPTSSASLVTSDGRTRA